MCPHTQAHTHAYTHTHNMWHSTCNNVICSYIDDDDLIQHIVIIDILQAFAKSSLQALRVVFESRIPFQDFLYIEL